MQRIMELTQGLKHHLLVPSQYKGGGPSIKTFRGCGLVVGRKEGLFWSSYQDFFWGSALLGWHFSQKRQAKGWGHLMHAIEVSGKVA